MVYYVFWRHLPMHLHVGLGLCVCVIFLLYTQIVGKLPAFKNYKNVSQYGGLNNKYKLQSNDVYFTM